MPPAASGGGVAGSTPSDGGIPAKEAAFLIGVPSFKAKLLFDTEW
jgi:hypothetical protein